MTKEKQNRLLKIVLIYVLMQPFFDILSFLSIRNIIPFNISTYLKPFFVFGLAIYMFFMYSNIKKNWINYFIFYSIFLIGHFLLLYFLLVPFSTMLHEFRYILNITYMIALFLAVLTIYKHFDDRKSFIKMIKKTILITMFLYSTLLIISVISGTSALTYDYSDKNKLGFKGWMDSGQIWGHALSICFPFMLYIILSPKREWYIRFTMLLIPVISVSLLGTKVPYYIILIVLSLYLVLSIFVRIYNKDFKRNYANIVIVAIVIMGMLISYKYTPVAYNTKINNLNLQTDIKSYNLTDINGESNINAFEDLIRKNKGKSKNLERLIQYNEWNIKSSKYLTKLYASGKVHPSDQRKKQLYYNFKKFSLSSIEYKVFGIGYLNQTGTFTTENDFFMVLFDFGILAFLLIICPMIIYFIYVTYFILRKIRFIDLETYLLYMGFGIFFCISIFAGITFIYTNFSIFLVMIIIMLMCKIDIIKNDIKKNRQIISIDFLVLHLGYGGIESATINSANALSTKYHVRIASFYKLSDNQSNKLNNNISVKYLYNGFPNRETFKRAVKMHKILIIFKEGFKAISILVKKKILVINYIINTKSDVIVSTRSDFNLLLSRFGKFDTIKIAQEHHYHNNNKKYINKLKKYNNIDYLFALTKTLENDYKEILKNNKHIKVVLVPNMLNDIPNKESSLEEKNIITVSRLDPGKKNDDIIKAFSKIKEKDWKLYIIGDGPEYNNLVNLIEKLNIKDRVILTGYKDKNEIEKYLLMSSIFLMASITEGLPMVLLEAMSYGVPCIAYETASGVSDIINSNFNGYVIKKRNEEEYIEKIENLIKNKKIRKDFGKNAKITSYTFSKDEILKKWLNILK